MQASLALLSDDAFSMLLTARHAAGAAAEERVRHFCISTPARRSPAAYYSLQGRAMPPDGQQRRAAYP